MQLDEVKKALVIRVRYEENIIDQFEKIMVQFLYDTHQMNSKLEAS
jgi:hypothetical protein